MLQQGISACIDKKKDRFRKRGLPALVPNTGKGDAHGVGDGCDTLSAFWPTYLVTIVRGDIIFSMAESIRRSFSSVILGIVAILICGIDSSAQSTGDCPEISVLGPAGVFQPGDVISFEVSIAPVPPLDLKLHWTTNAGKIIEGQSTRRIRIRYEMERGLALLTTVKIEGLPDNCANTASEVVPYEALPEPEIVSEFSSSITTINRKGLEKAVIVLNQHPNNQMYIIEYFPFGTSDAAMKRKKEKIMKFMIGQLRFDGSRITIVAAEDHQPRTRIYRIPPGASNPTP